MKILVIFFKEYRDFLFKAYYYTCKGKYRVIIKIFINFKTYNLGNFAQFMKKKALERLAQLTKQLKDKPVLNKITIKTTINNETQPTKDSEMRKPSDPEKCSSQIPQQQNKQKQNHTIKDKLYQMSQTKLSQFTNSQKWKVYKKQIAQHKEKISQNLSIKSSELTNNLSHNLSNKFAKVKTEVSSKIANVHESSKKNVEQLTQSILKKVQEMKAETKKQSQQQQQIKKQPTEKPYTSKIEKKQSTQNSNTSKKFESYGRGIISNIASKVNLDYQKLIKQTIYKGKDMALKEVNKTINRYKWIAFMLILTIVFVYGLATSIPQQIRLYYKDKAKLSLKQQKKQSLNQDQ